MSNENEVDQGPINPIESYGGPISYPCNRYLSKLFDGPVRVEEKLDGSQLSFSLIDGELVFKSRRQFIKPESAPASFKGALEYISERKDRLPEGVVFRGEVINSFRHNKITYGRIPKGKFVLFDL